ncbi:MAG: AtpZ/AtpI family protein [Chloroflexi bacterium]|nr:AtpZ/AtpI family protein [Chloroflexota bacterium]
MRDIAGPVALIIRLGAIVVTSTVLPVVLGLWLDERLHTLPIFTLIGLIGGTIISVLTVYRAVMESYVQYAPHNQNEEEDS